MFIIMRMLLLAGSITITTLSAHAWMVRDVRDDGSGYGTSKPVSSKLWFTSLTHWGLMTETVYFLFAFLTACRAASNSPDDGKAVATPWYVSVTRGLQSTMLPLSCVIMVVYWTLIWKGPHYEVINISTHGGNFLLMVLDFMFCQQPMKVSHIWVPMFFGFVYGQFTLIYFYEGGGSWPEGDSQYTYAGLNWNTHTSTRSALLSAGMVFVAAPVMFAVTFLFYTFRTGCFNH